MKDRRAAGAIRPYYENYRRAVEAEASIGVPDDVVFGPIPYFPYLCACGALVKVETVHPSTSKLFERISTTPVNKSDGGQNTRWKLKARRPQDEMLNTRKSTPRNDTPSSSNSPESPFDFLQTRRNAGSLRRQATLYLSLNYVVVEAARIQQPSAFRPPPQHNGEHHIILGRGSVAQSDRLADHEGHGFRFGLADLLGGEGAAFTAMQHLMSDLMDQRGEFLGGLHPGQQSDLAAVREPLGGCNALGEVQLDVLRLHKLEQPFAVSAHIAADFGEGGEFLAFGLRDVLSRDLRPSLCALDRFRQ
jgi:hypothetical protein